MNTENPCFHIPCLFNAIIYSSIKQIQTENNVDMHFVYSVNSFAHLKKTKHKSLPTFNGDSGNTHTDSVFTSWQQHFSINLQDKSTSCSAHEVWGQ